MLRFGVNWMYDGLRSTGGGGDIVTGFAGAEPLYEGPWMWRGPRERLVVEGNERGLSAVTLSHASTSSPPSRPTRRILPTRFSVGRGFERRTIQHARKMRRGCKEQSEEKPSFTSGLYVGICALGLLRTRPTSDSDVYRKDAMSKRSASPPPAQGTLIKRSRSSEPQNTSQLIISSSGKEREQALIRTVKRTSNLEAPIVCLSGAHGVSFRSLENAIVLVANRCDREKS